MRCDNNINDKNLVVQVITKKEVADKNIEFINSVLNDLRENADNSKNKLFIVFEKYNEDDKKIFEIEEVRQFVSKMFNLNNDLFYFLSNIECNSKIILACLGKVKEKKMYDNTYMGFELDLEDELRHNIMNGIISICDDDKVGKELVKNLFGYESWTV